MGLRFSALITGAVFAVSSLAHAATPVQAKASPEIKFPLPATAKDKVSPSSSGVKENAGSVNIAGAAQVSAILAYCKKVDAGNATEYQQILSNILSGHSGAEMNDDQKSPVYAANQASINAQLAKLPLSTGVSGCKGLLLGK